MYCASWSGGKDSCLACFLAMENGMKISRLVHFDRPNNLHGVDPALIRLQADLAGIPMVQRRVDSRDFEQEFISTLRSLKDEGVRGMVFGDIYLEPHKVWIDRTCRNLGIEAVLPLWGLSTEDILRQFFELGFVTIVASGDQKLIDRRFIGQKMGAEFADYLRTKKLDVCGENGEFHTFVTRGPLFRAAIEISDSEVTGRDGFWFLDVRRYGVIH